MKRAKIPIVLRRQVDMVELLPQAYRPGTGVYVVSAACRGAALARVRRSRSLAVFLGVFTPVNCVSVIFWSPRVPKNPWQVPVLASKSQQLVSCL